MLSSRDFQSGMAVITSTYPNSKIDLNNTMQMSIWFDNLKDLDQVQFALALKSIVATSEFAPTIAAIRKKCAEMEMPDKVDTEEAFGLVMRAIRNFGYMRADEAIASLPQQVQKAVMWMGGFKMICESENLDVTRGQFNKAMASVNAREHTNKALGEGLLEQIAHNTTKAEPVQYIEYEKPKRIDYDESLACISTVKDVMRKVCKYE